MEQNIIRKAYPVYKLVLSECARGKIDYICEAVSNTEWSGVLFYKVSGEFSDGSLVIDGVDIYMMNIGNPVYTSYDTSPEIISYMTDNGLLDCQIGLIHSHHNMSTNFSSTDIKTLFDNGSDSNHFVSLIVNNSGSYRARITRKATINRNIKEEIIFNSFNNESVVERRDITECKEEIQSFDLEVQYGANYAELDSRISFLRKEAYANPSKLAIDRELQTGLTMGCQYYDSDIDDDEEVDDDSATDGYSIHTPEKEILKIVSQIVSGTIEANYDMDDLVEFVREKMCKVYSNRFGSKDHPTADFSEWAVRWMKYVCRGRLIMGVFYMSGELMAYALELMRSLPVNPYLEKMQGLLEELQSFTNN